MNRRDSPNIRHGPTNIENGNNVERTNVPVRRIREQLFSAMFSKATIYYARSVPITARRIIEFCILFSAFVYFFILVYVHISFLQHPSDCLSHIHNNWPRDGILRVEILRNHKAGYTIQNSYDRERMIRRQQKLNEINLFSTAFRMPVEWGESLNLESSKDEEYVPANVQQSSQAENVTENLQTTMNVTRVKNEPYAVSLFTRKPKDIKVSLEHRHWEKENPAFLSDMNSLTNITHAGKDDTPVKFQRPTVADMIKESVSDVEKLVNIIWPQDEYIIEFSLEYGLLRLSQNFRGSNNVPVKIVVLDPTKDRCFGDPFARFLLERFIGYDDLLIVAVKGLIEKEDVKGYLRNVITGDTYVFVNRWTSRGSYLIAFIMMISFTLVISMLLRFSHQIIFSFIVDLLQMLEFNVGVTFPATQLITVILALVGLEAIMSEFFNDNSTAFYLIIIVWIGDQYETICCQRYLSKKYWPRFFYLYLYAFYGYHNRFNGYYSGLALLTSSLFIIHSMVFFYHHYELPQVIQNYNLTRLMAYIRQRHNNMVEFQQANTAGMYANGNPPLQQLIISEPREGSMYRTRIRFTIQNADNIRSLNRHLQRLLPVIASSIGRQFLRTFQNPNPALFDTSSIGNLQISTVLSSDIPNLDSQQVDPSHEPVDLDLSVTELQ